MHNLTRESQGCLRVTLQQILVPRGGDHFVQRHECSWCKESWPSARNKKKWPFSSPEPIVLFGHVVLKPSGSGDENENCPTPWHVIRMSSVRTSDKHKRAFPFSSPETAVFLVTLSWNEGSVTISRIALRMRMEHSRPLGGDKQGSGALARAEAGSAQNFYLCAALKKWNNFQRFQKESLRLRAILAWSQPEPSVCGMHWPKGSQDPLLPPLGDENGWREAAMKSCIVFVRYHQRGIALKALYC